MQDAQGRFHLSRHRLQNDRLVAVPVAPAHASCSAEGHLVGGYGVSPPSAAAHDAFVHTRPKARTMTAMAEW